MILFKAKSGKIFAQIQLDFSAPYDNNLTLAENEENYFSTEREKLKKYGFKPCGWNKELSEFVGTDWQLWEIATEKTVDELYDCYLLTKKEIFEYLISVSDELFKHLFTDIKYNNLAILYRKLGDSQKAKEYRDKATAIFNEAEESLLKYRSEKDAEEFYKNYIQGAKTYTEIGDKIIEYITSEDIDSNCEMLFSWTIQSAKGTFEKVFRHLGMEEQAEITKTIKIGGKLEIKDWIR